MIVVNLAFVPADERDRPPNFGEFDTLGCATGVSGLVLFHCAWNQAGVVGWTVPYIYELLIVGVVLLVAFAFGELQIAKHPLVPLRDMAKEAALTLSVVGAIWASFDVWVHNIWRLTENLRGYSPLAATAKNAPVAMSGLIAAVGTILIATTPVDQIYRAQTFVSIDLMPWGLDMSFPSATILLSNNIPKDDQGIASSLVNTVVNYSISLGLGIAGAIVQHVNDNGMDVLAGYRGAWYFGIGLDVLAVAFALYFMVQY